MIDKVIDHLYVSDAVAVLSELGQNDLKKLKVSHILTTSVAPIPKQRRIDNVIYKFIFLLDVDSQNLFANDLLAEALQFIDDGINSKGNVLVHCESGISRSISIVVAYTMRLYKCSFDNALALIRRSRPNAQPNDGFIQQLKIFASAGYNTQMSVLAENLDFLKYQLTCVNDLPKRGLESKSNGRLGIQNANLNEDVSNYDVKYTCRRCRQILFYDKHILKHEMLMNNCTEQSHPAGVECEFEILTLPMKWMNTSEYEGKILCPSCFEKIGHYIWGGRVCDGIGNRKCGAAVRPWFHIHKNKVDSRRNTVVLKDTPSK